MYRDDPRLFPLVITASVGHVSAMDATNGRIVWGVDPDGIRSIVRLHVDERRVVALGESELAVVGYADGKILGSIPTGGTTLLVEGERAFVSDSSVISCVDLAARKVLWSRRLGTDGVAAIGTPNQTVQADANR
jgi:hypothetical protein